MAALSKHLRISDREILAGTYDIYSAVFSNPPRVDRRGVENVITILGKSSPPQGLSIIDNSLLEEILQEPH
jgi:hypothetical protein